MAAKKPNEWKNDKLSMQRGQYGGFSLPKVTLLLGRLAIGPIQWAILRQHPLQRFGVPAPPSGGFITILGSRVPRLPFITVLMPTVLGLKHSLWVSTMMNESMTMPFAIFGVLGDLGFETINTLLFTTAAVNPLWSERLFYIGATVHFAAMAIELLAEIQRKAFKSKPENKGKLCTTGFWAITRHINYSMNVLFGFGMGLATGGALYTPLSAGMYLSNFIFNAIPSIEEYCKTKYGEEWQRYVEKVPWKLIPGIY
jgi:protein-S-isoprenylcysteine O-methyltransferase Ste14